MGALCSAFGRWARRLSESRRLWRGYRERDTELLVAGQLTAAQASRCHLFLQRLPAAAPEPADPLTTRQRARVERLVLDTTSLDPPFVTVREGAAGNFTYSGYLIDLWNIVTAELGLPFRLLPPGPSGSGALLQNGTWTGLVGELAEKRADVALSWFFYRDDRATVVDYVKKVPMHTGVYQFVLRAGKRTHSSIFDMFASLLRPLDGNVWLMILLSLAVLSGALTATVRLNRRRGESDLICREFTFGSSCLAAFMMVTSQGWAVTPNSASARIVTLSGWIMGMLISVGYTANLISHLVVVQPVAPIGTLAQFAAETEWTLAMQPSPGEIGDWAKSSDPTERHLYDRVVSGERLLRLDGTTQTLRAAAQPRTLLLYDAELLLTAIGEEACQLMPLPERRRSLAPKSFYMVLRKGLAPHVTKGINRVLQQLLQTGTLDRLKQRWFRQRQQQCSCGMTFHPLALVDLQAVLMIVPLGALAAFLLLAGELLIGRRGSDRVSGAPAARMQEGRGKDRPHRYSE
ncbi:glutamate receptor ionotropic, delta-1-like [Pollicipes pollicipes]|uniref:glutamate receptor ionotropic, delta-1-like n=1 Tax=Pollicipes pollicipes TaxID=41117 RepID=UPI00188493ED|nr:glutamate receptor ionotropic, delta-1-like [Pollicipes pollicipes]